MVVDTANTIKHKYFISSFYNKDMLPHIEKEYKMMITKEDYEFYLQHLSLETIEQTNYYYITSKENCAMRIREIEGHFYFTLKIKEKDYHQEYEFEIACNSMDSPQIQELLNQQGIFDYQYIGFMKTIRSKKEYQYGEFCLDQSSYFDTVDYEIEFELLDYTVDNNDEFMNILKMRNLEYRRSPHSKFKRFLIQKASK